MLEVALPLVSFVHSWRHAIISIETIAIKTDESREKNILFAAEVL